MLMLELLWQQVHAISALGTADRCHMQFALQNNVRCVLHLPEPFSPPALRLSARLKPHGGLKTADHTGTKEASELKAKFSSLRGVTASLPSRI